MIQQFKNRLLLYAQSLNFRQNNTQYKEKYNKHSCHQLWSPNWDIFRFYFVAVKINILALINIVAGNIFFWKTKDKMVFSMSYLKSPLLIIFSRRDGWKNKVLENALKIYLKTPGKLLEKSMSWSDGTMGIILSVTVFDRLSDGCVGQSPRTENFMLVQIWYLAFVYMLMTLF